MPFPVGGIYNSLGERGMPDWATELDRRLWQSFVRVQKENQELRDEIGALRERVIILEDAQ